MSATGESIGHSDIEWTCGFAQCGVHLYLVESVHQVAASRTETLIFRRHSIPNLVFTSHHRFRVLCAPPNFVLFDSRGFLIMRFVAPDVWGHAAPNTAAETFILQTRFPVLCATWQPWCSPS